MKQAGGTVIGLDWRVPLVETWNRVGPRGCDGQHGPHGACLEHPKRFGPKLAAFSTRLTADPGFIFNLGHGILPDTPYDNVRVLIDTVKEN
jgi:uroporphyrinogen decarboxylase